MENFFVAFSNIGTAPTSYVTTT